MRVEHRARYHPPIDWQTRSRKIVAVHPHDPFPLERATPADEFNGFAPSLRACSHGIFPAIPPRSTAGYTLTLYKVRGGNLTTPKIAPAPPSATNWDSNPATIISPTADAGRARRSMTAGGSGGSFPSILPQPTTCKATFRKVAGYHPQSIAAGPADLHPVPRPGCGSNKDTQRPMFRAVKSDYPFSADREHSPRASRHRGAKRDLLPFHQ